jgi:Kef-type K+ transport system membrane component KefB
MIILFFVFAAICGFAAFIIFDYLSKRGMKRNLSVFGLAFCFLMAAAAHYFGLESILGAYIAGLVFCHSKAERYIEARSETLSFLFFSPVFFVSVGLKISFDGLSRSNLIFAGAFFAVALATKFLGCGLGAKINKYSLRDSLRIGVGMITRCEVAIIASTLGVSMGFLDPKYFAGIILAVIATTLVTPILLKLAFAGKDDN